MCGIIGYVGVGSAMPRIIHGLTTLEYRGYDSAGVAFFENGNIRTVKQKAELKNLDALGKIMQNEDLHCGIGHTRWATHGEPSDINSHPHGTQKVRIVHNGIIENYAEIKEFLAQKGYTFESETDTEAAAKLLDFFYAETEKPMLAIRKTREIIRGSYAVCALFQEQENTIYGFRKDNPLIVATGEDGNFFASDISAVLAYTKQFRRVEEQEIAVLDNEEIRIMDESENLCDIQFETAEWDAGAAEKEGFPHFMLKEIFEEPDAIARTVRALAKDGLSSIDSGMFCGVERIHIIACGTAMHAGLAGKYAIEKMSGVAVSVELASEFRYRNPVLNKNDIVIVVSQSGETADTLAALRLAKECGITTIGIVNVRGSSVAREAEYVLFTDAGPEIAVASTKAYSVQLSVMLLLAIKLGEIRGKYSKEKSEFLTESLIQDVPDAIEKALEKKEECLKVAKKYKDCKSVFFMGRGIDYTLACEAALKMKEISYIHCEGIAAGEMKHGTISLITQDVPVFVFATDESLLEKTVSNIKEVAARGARVILFCKEDFDIPEGIAEDIIRIPGCKALFEPVIAATPAQLTAYYVACELGLDVDKPRNLAKSVTVE